MNSIIKTRLVKIGNSQGIRIPKVLLEQVGLSGEVQVEVQADHLILRSAHTPRSGWDEQFQRMAANGDDTLLDPGATLSTQWDSEEWVW